MALLKNVKLEQNLLNPGILPDGSLLTSQRTTLFDGKVLNTDDTDFWENAGTGTTSFSNNIVNMSVTSGQWIVTQSRRRIHYSSGKPQIVEMTFDNFETEANVIKRIGYFSSSEVSPYNTIYDGFWIEDNGATKYLKCANLGTETVSIPLSEWDPYWVTYDFSKFSVIQFYFLWLGGAALIAFGGTAANGFKTMASAQYVESAEGTICSSPNQPVRYEIRSSTGTGNLRRICSQVSTAGSIKESGKSLGVYSTALACNTIGTIYALLGIKKRADRRDISVKFVDIAVSSTGTTDAGTLLLLKNPTLSAALSYSNNSNIQSASGTGQTVTETGRILHATPCEQTAIVSPTADDYLTWLSMSISNTPDEYVLAFRPETLNQSRFAAINMLEYI